MHATTRLSSAGSELLKRHQRDIALNVRSLDPNSISYLRQQVRAEVARGTARWAHSRAARTGSIRRRAYTYVNRRHRRRRRQHLSGKQFLRGKVHRATRKIVLLLADNSGCASTSHTYKRRRRRRR